MRAPRVPDSDRRRLRRVLVVFHRRNGLERDDGLGPCVIRHSDVGILAVGGLSCAPCARASPFLGLPPFSSA